MPKRSHKSKGSWWLAAIVLLSILLITYQIKTGQPIEAVSRPIVFVFSTSHKIFLGLTRRASQFWEDYIWLIRVEQDNLQLRQEVVKLKEMLSNCREYSLENERLRALLNFKRKTAVSFIPAIVISKDPSSMFRTIIIDKGYKDGVNKDKAVVTHQGVVGRIIEAYPSTSKVLLINDPNSGLAVSVQRTRDEGIMIGWKEDVCKINYLARTAQVVKNDILVTSGLGGIFPKGLMVGWITDIEKNKYGLFQYVEAVPSVDFSKLEEVLVVR